MRYHVAVVDDMLVAVARVGVFLRTALITANSCFPSKAKTLVRNKYTDTFYAAA